MQPTQEGNPPPGYARSAQQQAQPQQLSAAEFQVSFLAPEIKVVSKLALYTVI